jgi:hypothetical protein
VHAGLNPAPAGLLRISLACMQPLSGSGAFLSVPVEARQAGSSPVHIAQCNINEDAVPCSTAEGIVSVRRAQQAPNDGMLRSLRMSATAQ